MKTVFGMSLWIVLFVPLFSVMLKLTVYLQENPFKQWWITIIWVLAIPLTTLTLFIVPKENYIKKVGK